MLIFIIEYKQAKSIFFDKCNKIRFISYNLLNLKYLSYNLDIF